MLKLLHSEVSEEVDVIWRSLKRGLTGSAEIRGNAGGRTLLQCAFHRDESLKLNVTHS